VSAPLATDKPSRLWCRKLVDKVERDRARVGVPEAGLLDLEPGLDRGFQRDDRGVVVGFAAGEWRDEV